MPDYYPKLISIAIIILGLVIALNAVRALKTVSAREEKPGGKTIAYPAVMLIIAYLAVYYLHSINLATPSPPFCW